LKDPKQPIDLTDPIQRGIEHIQHSVDRARHARPYFRFNLTQPPIWSRHQAADVPHTTGRFLHALNLCRPIVGLPDDDELLDGLRQQIFSSCDHDDGFAWDDMAHEPDPIMAYMHHQREALLALLAVWDIYQDERARQYAQKLVAAMEQATRATGTYPGKQLASDGWQAGENLAVTTSERAISALLAYGRTCNDPLGLELAQRFGRHALSVTFGPSGELTPASSTHIHSITGTVASLVELGLTTGQQEFIERARLVFDAGVLPFRIQTGWVKEETTARPGRGEANCTSDMIEAACLLGMAGHPTYFEDAERMLRNHLLASQLDDLSWVEENEGMENTETHAYQDLQHRALGAFCFGEPNGYHTYNSDLSGAALQGLAVAWNHIATTDADGGHRVNLLLSHEDDVLTITSRLPEAGHIAMSLKAPLKHLRIRVPTWCNRRSLSTKINDKKMSSKYEGEYLKLEDLAANSQVDITFEQPEFYTLERAIGHPEPSRVEWRGNTVLAMSGTTPYMPLYPAISQ